MQAQDHRSAAATTTTINNPINFTSLSLSSNNEAASSSASSASTLTPTTKPGVSECPESLTKWYCLNGGTCFSVRIQESVLYNCWCPIGFNGLRCDYKYTKIQDKLLDEVNQKTTATNANATEGNRGAHSWPGSGSTFDSWKPESQSSDSIQLQPPTTTKQKNFSDSHSGDSHLLIIYIFVSLLLILTLIIVIHRYCKKNDLLNTFKNPIGRTYGQTQPGQHCNNPSGVNSIRLSNQCNGRPAGINMNNNNINGDYINRKINHHGNGSRCRQSIAFQLDQILKRELNRRLKNVQRNQTGMDKHGCDTGGGGGGGGGLQVVEEAKTNKQPRQQHEYYHGQQQFPLMYQVFCPDSRSQLQNNEEGAAVAVGNKFIGQSASTSPFNRQREQGSSSSNNNNNGSIGSSIVTNTTVATAKMTEDQQGHRMTPMEPVWFC